RGAEDRNPRKKTRCAPVAGRCAGPQGEERGAMMTARKAGELAAEGVWVTLRRLRDQWVLLVFAASVLFWARDVYDRFVDLPDRVARLEAGRAVGDGWPGDVVTVDSAPVAGARCVCRDGNPAALVVNAAGM